MRPCASGLTVAYVFTLLGQMQLLILIFAEPMHK